MDNGEIRSIENIIKAAEGAWETGRCLWCGTALTRVQYHLVIEYVADGKVNAGPARTCSWTCMKALVESPESPES